MNPRISRGNLKIIPKLMKFMDILYKALTGVTFLAGSDAVIFQLRSAALGLSVYI